MRKPKLNDCGIYRFSAPSGKCYVGQSTQLSVRHSVHMRLLKKGTHQNKILLSAYKVYGSDLRYEVVELCAQEMLTEREQAWMDASHCEYNRAKVASNPMLCPEVKALHSLAVGSSEYRAKQSTSQRVESVRSAKSKASAIYQNLPTSRLANSLCGLARHQDPEFKLATQRRGSVAKSEKIKLVETEFGLAGLTTNELYAIHKAGRIRGRAGTYTSRGRGAKYLLDARAKVGDHPDKTQRLLQRRARTMATKHAAMLAVASGLGLLGLSDTELRALRQRGRAVRADAATKTVAGVARNLYLWRQKGGGLF